MFSQIMVKILGFIYKLVITNAPGFGNTGLGYYSAGYQVYSLLLALSSIGIPNVVSKLVSERVAIGDNKGAQRIFKICMIFFTTIGFALSLILFFGAEAISNVVYNVSDIKYVMQVLAPAVVFVAISAVFRGYFAGLNDMKPTSYSQVIEQFLNTEFEYIAQIAAPAEPLFLVILQFEKHGLAFIRFMPPAVLFETLSEL